MNPKFKVVFTEEAADFLDSLSDKARNKVYFNIDKATFINDPEIFKKLEDDIWEFRTLYQQQAIRLFCFLGQRQQIRHLGYLNARIY